LAFPKTRRRYFIKPVSLLFLSPDFSESAGLKKFQPEYFFVVRYFPFTQVKNFPSPTFFAAHSLIKKYFCVKNFCRRVLNYFSAAANIFSHY
jgi:hypothetical protein